MTILRAVNGKFFDIPDDKVASFEVAPDRLEGTLEKAGLVRTPGSDAPRQGSGGAPPSSPAHAPGPVVVQIFAASEGAPSQGHAAAPAPQAGPDGEVDPYWITWWRNVVFYRPWGNVYWMNW